MKMMKYECVVSVEMMKYECVVSVKMMESECVCCQGGADAVLRKVLTVVLHFVSVKRCHLAMLVCVNIVLKLAVLHHTYECDPPKGGRGFMMSPTVWNLRAASCLYLLFCSFAYSPVALSVLSLLSAFGPFYCLLFP